MAAEAGEEQANLEKDQLEEEAQEYETTKRPVDDKLGRVCKDEHEESICEPAASRDPNLKKDEMEDSELEYKELEATGRVAPQDEESTSEERTEIVSQDDLICKMAKDSTELIQIYKDQAKEVREQYEETKVRANEKLEGTSIDEHDDVDALSATENLDRENAQDSASGKIKEQAEEISSEFNLDPGLVKGEMEDDCFNQKELEAAEQVAIHEQESNHEEEVLNNIEKVCQDDCIDKKAEENTKLLHEHKDQTEEAAQEDKYASDIDNKKLASSCQDEYNETELLLPDGVEKADDMNKYSEPRVSGKENAQDSATVNIEEHMMLTASYYNSDPGEMKDEPEGGYKDYEATGQVPMHDKDSKFEEKELMDREVSQYIEMHKKIEEIAELNHKHKDQFDEVAQTDKITKQADEEKLAGLCKDENKESITETLPSGEGAQGNDVDESSEEQILKIDIEQDFSTENNEGDIKQTICACNLDTDAIKDDPQSEYQEFEATEQASKHDVESMLEDRELTNTEEVTQDNEMDKKNKETTALMHEHKEPLEEIAENDEATEHEGEEKLANRFKDDDEETISKCISSGDGDQGIQVDESSEEKVSESTIEQELFTAHNERDVEKTTCEWNVDADQIKEETESGHKEHEEAGQIPIYNEVSPLGKKELTNTEDVSHNVEMHKKTEVTLEHMNEHKEPLEKVGENDEAIEHEDVEKLESPSKEEGKKTIRDKSIQVDEPSEEKLSENEIEQLVTAHIERDVEKTTIKYNVNADQTKEETEGEHKELEEAGKIPKHNEASPLGERKLPDTEDVSNHDEMYKKTEVIVEHLHEQKDPLEEVEENDEATEHEEEDKETFSECIPSEDGDQGIQVDESSEEKVSENTNEQELFIVHSERDDEKTTCDCNVDADQIKEETEGEHKEREEAGQIPKHNEASPLGEKELTDTEDVTHDEEMHKKTEVTLEHMNEHEDPLEEMGENDEAIEHEDVEKLENPSKEEDKETIIASGDGDQGIQADEPSEEKVSENEIEQLATAHIERDVEKTTVKYNVDADQTKQETEGEHMELEEARQIPKHNEASPLGERKLPDTQDFSNHDEMHKKTEVIVEHLHEHKDPIEEVAENDEATEHEDAEKLASRSKDEYKETISEFIPSGDGDQGIQIDESSEEKVSENKVEQELYTTHIERDVEKTSCECNVYADQIKEETEGEHKEHEEAGQIPKHNEASKEITKIEDVSHDEEMYKKTEVTVEHMHEHKEPLGEVGENDEATKHEDVEKLESPSKEEDKETIRECIQSGDGDQGIQVDEPLEEKVVENEIEQLVNAHIERDVEETTVNYNLGADQIKEETECEHKELEEAGQIPKHYEASPLGEKKLTDTEDVSNHDEMYKKTEVAVEDLHEQKHPLEDVAENDEATEHEDVEKLASCSRDEDKESISEYIPSGDGYQGIQVDESSEENISENRIEQEIAHIEKDVKKTTCDCNVEADQIKEETEGEQKEIEEIGQIPNNNEASQLGERELTITEDVSHGDEMYKKTEVTVEHMHGHKDPLEEVAENYEATEHEDVEKLASRSRDEDKESISEYIPSGDEYQDIQVDESSEENITENKIEQEIAHIERDVKKTTFDCNLDADQIKEETEGEQKKIDEVGRIPNNNEASQLGERELTITEDVSHGDEMYKKTEVTIKHMHGHKDPLEEVAEHDEATGHEDKLASPSREDDKETISECIPSGNRDQDIQVYEPSEEKVSENEIEQELFTAHIERDVEKTTCKCNVDADQIKEETEGEHKELEETGQFPKHNEASSLGERELTNIDNVSNHDEMYKKTEVTVEHLLKHKDCHEEVAEDDEASQHVHDEKLVSFCKDKKKATSSEPIPYGGGDQGNDVDESSETKDSERAIEEELAATHVEGHIEQMTRKCILDAEQMYDDTEGVYKETEETGQVPTHDDDSTLGHKELIDMVENSQDNEMYKKTEETAEMVHGRKDQLEEVAENDEAAKHGDDEKLACPYKDEDEETISEHIPSVDEDQDNQVDESSEARVSEKENELELLSANVKRHIEPMASECKLETDDREDKTEGQNKEFEATGQVPTHDEEIKLRERQLTSMGDISEDEIYNKNEVTAKFMDGDKEHHKEVSQDDESTKHEDDENLVSLCKDEDKNSIGEPVPYGVDQGNDVTESSETKYSEKEITQEFANAHLEGQIEQTTSKCKLDAGQRDETEGVYTEIEATGEVPTYDEESRPEQREIISKVEVSEDHEIYKKTEQKIAELMHDHKDQIEVAEKDEATNHDGDQKVASMCRDGYKETLNEPIPSIGGDQDNDIHESSEANISDTEIVRRYANANTEENVQQTINKCNLDDGQMKDETGGEYKDIEATWQIPTADEESALDERELTRTDEVSHDNEMYKKTEQTTELIDEHQEQFEIAQDDEEIKKADKEKLANLCRDEDKESISDPILSTGGDQGGDVNKPSEARDSKKDTEQEFATANTEDHIKQTDSKCNLDDTEGECKECEATAQVPKDNEERTPEARELFGIVEVSQDDKYKTEETAELTYEYKDKLQEEEEEERKKEADEGIDEPTEVDKLLQQSSDDPESLWHQLEEVIQNDADAKHEDDEMPQSFSKNEENEIISESIPSSGGDQGVDESSDRKVSVEEMEQEFAVGNIQGNIEQTTSKRNLDAGQLNDETGSECKEFEATEQISTNNADADSTLERRELITTVQVPQDDEMYKITAENSEVKHEQKLQEVVPNDEANRHAYEEMPANSCKDDHKETISEFIPSRGGDQSNIVDESSETKFLEEKIQQEFVTANIERHIKQMTSEPNLETVEKEGEKMELEATRQIPTNDDDSMLAKRELISIVEVPQDDEVCKTKEIDVLMYEHKDQLEQVHHNEEASKYIDNETLASICKDDDKENISTHILSGGGDHSNDVGESSEAKVSDEKVEQEFATANIEGHIQQTISKSNLDAVQMKGEREGECEELEATVKVQTLDKESTLKERVLAYKEEVSQDDAYKTEETADVMYKHKDHKVANNDEALNQSNNEKLASPCKDDEKESITEPITSVDEDQGDANGSSEAKKSQIGIEQVFPTVNDEEHIEQMASKCELDANQIKEEIEGKYSDFEAAGQVLIHGEETTPEERDLINKKEVPKDDDTAELIHENKVQPEEAEQEYETSKHDEQLINDFKEDHEETLSKPVQSSGGEQANDVDGSIIEKNSEKEIEKWSATLDIIDHFEQTTTLCNKDTTQMEDEKESEQLENEKFQETGNVAALDQESTQEERVLIETEEGFKDVRFKKTTENNEDQYEEIEKDEVTKPIEEHGEKVVCKNKHTETVSEATGQVAIHAEEINSEENLSINTEKVPIEYEVHMKTEEDSKLMHEDQNGVINNISMPEETTLQYFKEKKGENIVNLIIEHKLVEEIGHPRGEVSSDLSPENIDHEDLSGDSLNTNEEISIISTKQASLKEEASNIAEGADEQIKEFDLSADYTIEDSLGVLVKPKIQEKLESQSNMDGTSLDEQVYDDAATVNSSQQQREPEMYNIKECLDKLEISLDEIPEKSLSVEEKAPITKDSAAEYPPDIQGTSQEEHEAISLAGTMGRQSSISSHEAEKDSKEGPNEFKVIALENKELTTEIHIEATIIPEEKEEITEKQDNGIHFDKETVGVGITPDISIHPNTYSSEIKFENITKASETTSNQPGNEETTEEGDIESLKMDGSASKYLVDFNASHISSEQSISSVVSEDHELNEDTMVIEENSEACNLMTAATELAVKGEQAAEHAGDMHEALGINKKMKDDKVLSAKNLEKKSEDVTLSDQRNFTSKEDGLFKDKVSPKVSMEKSISEAASEDDFYGLIEASQVIQTNTSESKSRELLEGFPESFQTISSQSGKVEDMDIEKSQLIADEPEESFTSDKVVDIGKSQLIADEPEESFTSDKVVDNEINEDQESERSLQPKDTEDVKQNKGNNAKLEFGVSEIVITSECNLENINEKESTNNEVEVSKVEDVDPGMAQDLVPHKLCKADGVGAINRDGKDMEIINNIVSESTQKNQEQAGLDDLPVSRYLMERILQEEGEKIDKPCSDDSDKRIQNMAISRQHNDNSIQEKDDRLDVSLVGLGIQDRSKKADKVDNQCSDDSFDSTKEESIDLQKAEESTERVDQSPKSDKTESAPARKSCLESALEIQELQKPNNVEEYKDTSSYLKKITIGKNQEETESLNKDIEVPSKVKPFKVDNLSEEGRTNVQELERDDKASHDVQHVKEPESYLEKMTKSKIQEETESLNKEIEFPSMIETFEADTSLHDPIKSLQELERDDKSSHKVQHEKEPASFLEKIIRSKIQEENLSLNKDIEVPSINKTIEDDTLSQEGRTSLKESDRDRKASYEVLEQTSSISEAVEKPKSVCHVENPLNHLVDQAQKFDSDSITPGVTLEVSSEPVSNADQDGYQPELQGGQSKRFISGDKVTEELSNFGSGSSDEAKEVTRTLDKKIELETQKENKNNSEERQSLELDKVQQVAVSAKSTEETIQVDEILLKEKDLKNSIHEEQTSERIYCHIEEMKDLQENYGKEEDDGNKDKGSTPDSAVMVEVKEADLKPTHKKSHNILSGVKHSLAKVKKAIIGKSSHSKTVSPK